MNDENDMTDAYFDPADPFEPNTAKLESVDIAGVTLTAGDRVRLAPRTGGDVFDLALAGREATIESIEQDYEDQIYLAVTVDDDPGRDFGMQRKPAHRFFFRLGEIEPLPQERSS